MKKTFRNFTAKIIPITAIGAFLICSSLNNNNVSAPAAQCNIGYNVSAANLKQFMIDSLKSNLFPGGVYLKADLLAAINSLNALDDTVYLTHMYVNCSESNGTDLVFVSRHTKNPKYARVKKTCPCDPPRPCCRNAACIPKIPFPCFTFQIFTPVAPVSTETASVISLADEN